MKLFCVLKGDHTHFYSHLKKNIYFLFKQLETGDIFSFTKGNVALKSTIYVI